MATKNVQFWQKDVDLGEQLAVRFSGEIVMAMTRGAGDRKNQFGNTNRYCDIYVTETQWCNTVWNIVRCIFALLCEFKRLNCCNNH